ncbi:LUD domain-containing protein [Salinarchaeum laminariae]|uniref:LUD domain-containing protein n=1 Tax=Salinarchaeum laminariae TaxID=869888 RepID=UPI0020C1208B|nr:LUD domain-containing protein [Salinarchaeum laminariae]
MSTSAISSFEESLSTRGLPLTRTAAADAADELTALVEPPAIGTQLPYSGVSLPENVITELSPSVLESATVGITPAALAIADYGSVVIPDDGSGSEHVSLFADEHVAVVAASDVVASMSEAIGELGEQVRDGLTSAIVATGPSATADMGELVMGAHGPKVVEVVLVTDR